MNANHEPKSWYYMKFKKTTDPVKAQSNKDIVKDKYPKAECIKHKLKLFHICVKSGKNINPVHSGFTKNESDAWKRAAHQVL